MGLYLFAAFVAVPIIEIALLIEIGGLIGTPATILLVIATAAAGSYLLRLQGRSIFAKAQSELNQGRLPAQELFDGLCLFAAGLLLLTPGIFTDVIGGLLLVPMFRRWLLSRSGAWVMTSATFKHQPFDQERSASGPESRTYSGPKTRPGPSAGPSAGPVEDATFTEIPDTETSDTPSQNSKPKS